MVRHSYDQGGIPNTQDLVGAAVEVHDDRCTCLQTLCAMSNSTIVIIVVIVILNTHEHTTTTTTTTNDHNGNDNNDNTY